MERLTPQQRLPIVQLYYENQRFVRNVFRAILFKKLNENPVFYREILFSDESHFWLNGTVNKQNCRLWADEQPEEYQELPLYPIKTVWCGLWAGGIIGP